jgi:NAD-dependent protein deacetylase/lipoamidase
LDHRLVALLASAERMLVFTGAGISTGSGIRDFRGPQGVWKTRKPVLFEQFLASAEARREYWDQKLEAWPAFRDALPNAAHRAVTDLDRAGRVAMVVTQNIDGLHAQAGIPPERLVELHGTNAEVECLSCHERTPPGPHLQAFARTQTPPRCRCGGLLKPATISFGQALRVDDLRRAGDAAARCDLVLALGSTLSVYPAASFPLAAAERGVPYVIINRGETEHDGQPVVTLRLEGDVVEQLPPAVEAALSAGRGPVGGRR